MNSLKKFIATLDSTIIKMNNEINKTSDIDFLNRVLLYFNVDKILDLTIEDYEIIKSNLEINLDELELGLLNGIVNLPSEMREMKKVIGMGEKQKEIILSINSKIKNTIEKYKNIDFESTKNLMISYKNLLSKLNQNDLNLITEINLISKILDENNFTYTQKIEVFKQINDINSKIFNNFGIEQVDLSDEEVISFESLEETNIAFDELKKIFSEYKISWLSEEIWQKETNTKKRSLIESYKQKLLKYGNYDKISQFLNYLKAKKLDFIFDKPEILTKTLLLSSIDKIEEVFEKSEINGIDPYELLKMQPSIFFPTVKSANNTTKLTKMKVGDSCLSGALTNYLNNINLFNEYSYPACEIYVNCPSIFLDNPNTLRKVLNKLHLYKINFRYPNGGLKKGFSVLSTLDVLDKIDIGIECGCYNYYQDNISKLVDPNLNLYRVKLARSLGYTDSMIFKTYKKADGTLSLCLPAVFGRKKETKFGESKDNTFTLYGAKKVNVENQEIYDSIIGNSENGTITENIQNDTLIMQLDSLYKDKDNDMIYNFDGVIISRFKVLRHYQTLISNPEIDISKNVLFYVITLFSMLNEQEIKIIEQCLENIKFKERTL